MTHAETSAPPPPLRDRLTALITAAADFDQALVDRAHWAVAATPLVDAAHEFSDDDVALIAALSDTLKWVLVVEGLMGHWEECDLPPDAGCNDCMTYATAKRRMAEVITAARPALDLTVKVGDVVEHNESGRKATVTDVGSTPFQVRLTDGTRASWSSENVSLLGRGPSEPRLTVDDRGALWLGDEWVGQVDPSRKGQHLGLVGRLRDALGQP